MYIGHQRLKPVMSGKEMEKKETEHFCVDHSEEKVKLACSHCYKTLCLECVVNGRCSAELKDLHKCEIMNKLSQDLQRNLVDFATKLEKSSSQLSSMEKQTLALLAEKKKACQDMKDTVDKVTHEQLAAIQRKAEGLKLEIDDHVGRCSKLADQCLDELTRSRKWVEDLYQEICSLIRQQVDYNIIKNYKSYVEAAESVLKKDIPQLSFPLLGINKLDQKRDVEIELLGYELLVRPHQLEPSFESLPVKQESIEWNLLIETKAGLRTTPSAVCWLSDGNLMCGGFKMLEIRDKTLNVMKQNNSLNGTAYSVAPLYENILVLNDNRKGFTMKAFCSIDLYSSDLRCLKTIVKDVPHGSHMSAQENKIAVLESSTHHLKLYSADGSVLHDFILDVKLPLALALVEQGSVLVLDLNSRSVFKYNPKGKVKVIWKSESQKNPLKLSTDEDGCIYVACQAGDICVLRNDGCLLRELSHQGLSSGIRDVSVSSENVAVACHDGIKLFKLNY